MTNTSIVDLYTDFVCSRRTYFHIFNGEIFASFPSNSSFAGNGLVGDLVSMVAQWREEIMLYLSNSIGRHIVFKSCKFEMKVIGAQRTMLESRLRT